ncbi:MAG: hypothetical protein PVS3B1_37800 [Ktedonobacteraceae bacterium]
MFKRILVPLDGSKRAERALPIAARIAREANGTVILARVVSIATELWPYVNLEVAHTQAVIEAELFEAAQYLKNIVATPELEGISVETVALHGPTAATILSIAHTHGIDLITICSRSYTGTTRSVMGSTADKIACHAAASVLVLRDGGPFPLATDSRDAHPFRALVALDGSSRAATALLPAAGLAAALASPERGTLHLARVVKPVLSDTEEAEDEEQYPFNLANSEREVLEATRYLSTTVEHLRTGHLSKIVDLTWSAIIDTDVARGLVRMGECNESLLNEGDRCNEFDFIAIATHGYSGMQNWALGSTTQRVLSATRLPLLIVRPPDMINKRDAMLVHSSITTIDEMHTIHSR